VQTLEVGDLGGRPFIAMEYLDGQSLNAILLATRKANLPLEVGFVAKILCEALAGLHYAHELKDFDGTALDIVHRDVSPHNLFVTYEGEVKIVDFGIAKAATNASQTELGAVKGKVAYMAPEQAKGAGVDRRADIFAMGLVLWEMLASRRMLEGDSTIAILERLLHEPLPTVREARPDIDPQLGAAVSKALAKNPAERFQTAQEMRAALQPFTAGVSREAVGHKIQTMFDSERTRIHRQIQETMKGKAMPAGGGETDAPTITMLVPGMLPEITTGSSSAPTAPVPNALTLTVPNAAPPRTSRGVIIASVIAAMCAAIALFGMLQLRSRGTSTAGASVPAPPLSPSSVVVPAPLVSTSTASASTAIPSPVSSATPTGSTSPVTAASHTPPRTQPARRPNDTNLDIHGER
jgi:serine/threonine protein kinase